MSDQRNSILTMACVNTIDSDIRGGNSYQSPFGSEWRTALVKTGIHKGDSSHVKPSVIVEDVYDAVSWAVAEMDKKQ